MKPERKQNSDFKFEQVPTGKFVSGTIEDIQRDKERISTFQGKQSIKDCVRFKFRLEGCEFPHYSRWETFNYGPKSNLYKKYLVPLVPNAKPDMDFDLQKLCGMSIKTFWVQNGEYQNLQLILPNDAIPAVVGAEADEESPI